MIATEAKKILPTGYPAIQHSFLTAYLPLAIYVFYSKMLPTLQYEPPFALGLVLQTHAVPLLRHANGELRR